MHLGVNCEYGQDFRPSWDGWGWRREELFKRRLLRAWTTDCDELGQVKWISTIIVKSTNSNWEEAHIVSLFLHSMLYLPALHGVGTYGWGGRERDVNMGTEEDGYITIDEELFLSFSLSVDGSSFHMDAMRWCNNGIKLLQQIKWPFKCWYCFVIQRLWSAAEGTASTLKSSHYKLYGIFPVSF